MADIGKWAAMLLAVAVSVPASALVPGIWAGSDTPDSALAFIPSVDEKLNFALRCNAAGYDVFLDTSKAALPLAVGERVIVRWSLNKQPATQKIAQATTTSILAFVGSSRDSNLNIDLIAMDELEISFWIKGELISSKFMPVWTKQNTQFMVGRVLNRCKMS